MDHAGRLPRLAPQAYQGRGAVHWTMTLHQHATGWLDALRHARLREALLHACVRAKTLCATYCLMPDHAHFLMLGLSDTSDQKAWARLFRAQWNACLPTGIRLQRQAYDHVLRDTERERNAFAQMAAYILENPVRAGLVSSAASWPYTGCLVPGYPSLDPHADRFWDSLWLAHAAVSQP